MLQRNQLSFLRRQLQQRLFERQQVLGRAFARRRQNLKLIEAACLDPSAIGEQLETTVSENRIKPGIELTPRIKLVEGLIRVNECFLDRIQRVFTAADDS